VDAQRPSGELRGPDDHRAALRPVADLRRPGVVPDQIQDHIMHSGVRILGLAPNHGLEVARLPMHHRDPFDRLLIAQARSEQVTIVTADVRIADYDVLTIDAST